MWTANLNTQLRAWLITSEKAGIGDESSVFLRTLSTSPRSGRLVSSEPMIWLMRSKSCKLIWSILPGVLQGTDWKCLPNKKHSILTGTVTFQRVKQDQTQQLSNFLIVAKNANLAFNLVISWEENVSPLTSIDKICFTHVPTVTFYETTTIPKDKNYIGHIIHNKCIWILYYTISLITIFQISR